MELCQIGTWCRAQSTPELIEAAGVQGLSDKSADPEALGRELQGSYLEAGDGTAQHGCGLKEGWLCQTSSVTLIYARGGTVRVVCMPQACQCALAQVAVVSVES